LERGRWVDGRGSQNVAQIGLNQIAKMLTTQATKRIRNILHAFTVVFRQQLFTKVRERKIGGMEN